MGPVALYSNLLLHNVMPTDFRGMSEPGAGVGFYRTPPLWGIGLAEDFQGGQGFFMHDGRARSLREAIELHGGEAEASRDAFVDLSGSQQSQPIAFLRSL